MSTQKTTLCQTSLSLQGERLVLFKKKSMYVECCKHFVQAAKEELLHSGLLDPFQGVNHSHHLAINSQNEIGSSEGLGLLFS